MATSAYDDTESSTQASTRRDDQVEGAGWLAFAAILLGLAGTWNVIVGLLAIGDSKVYGPNTTYVFSGLHTWGWIVLLLGALELFAAFTLFAGSEFARWAGIGAAGLNALGQLAFIPVYPWWGVSMFAVDVLVIYGLSAYAGKKITR
jgi:hypothetical protein